MNKYVLLVASFLTIPLVLLADHYEVEVPVVGTALWGLIIIGGAGLLYLQLKNSRLHPAFCAVALIPYVNVVAIPLFAILAVLLPKKTV